eukprot:gene7682-5387_t
MTRDETVAAEPQKTQNATTTILELALRVERHETDPKYDRKVLETCVRQGGDVCAKEERLQTCALSSLIRAGEVELVLRCMASPNRIDFSKVTCRWDMAPLHWACMPCLTDDETAAMLRAVISRAALHPEKDRFDWEQRYHAGKDMMNSAAAYQKLSIVWPIVRDVDFFREKRHKKERLRLTGLVWAWDWHHLTEEDRAAFDITDAYVVEVEESTAQLVKLSHMRNPDASIAQDFVETRGANVLFRAPLLASTALHQFVRRGEWSCTRACLETPHSLDLTQRDAKGNTVLHAIFLGDRHSDDDVGISLNLILDRIDKHRSGDVIQWHLKNKDGKDFVSLARENQQWSLMNGNAFENNTESTLLRVECSDRRSRVGHQTYVQDNNLMNCVGLLVSSQKKYNLPPRDRRKMMRRTSFPMKATDLKDARGTYMCTLVTEYICLRIPQTKVSRFSQHNSLSLSLFLSSFIIIMRVCIFRSLYYFSLLFFIFCLNEIMLEEDNTNEAICFSDGCRDPTAELQRLCASPSSISDTSLKELVEMGADVCCPIGSDKCPLLIICMEAINRIDFTLTDPVLGETILHIAARQPNGTCLKLAKMISDRTETRLDDKISLEILDADHKDALSVAGENGNVESMYQLRCPCFESDVSKAKAFLPNGAPFFELTQPMLRANEATMQLLDLLREYFYYPPISLVRECILRGADICVAPLDGKKSILNEFIFRGELEMVNCLLETPREMDMTVADTITQGTTIHGMLTALFRHAKQYHDTIDFSVRNRWGQDVWSCGAWHDVLSVLINCMRMERVSLSRVLPGEKREDPRTASELHNSSVAVEKNSDHRSAGSPRYEGADRGGQEVASVESSGS